MNVDELKSKLRELGIRDRSYVIGDSVAIDQYVLKREDSGWVVYYEERGERNDLQRFLTEQEACDHFLKTLLDDPTTRVRSS